MTALLVPLLPLAAAALAVASPRARTHVVALVLTALAATIVVGSVAALTEPSLAWAWSPTIEVGLAVNGFGRVMVVLVPLIALPICGYAAVTEHDGRTRLMVLLLAFAGAMLLLVTAADFITLLMAWELVGVASWLLIGHRWNEHESVGAATRAFLTTRLGDVGLFIAAGVTFSATGSYGLAGVGDADQGARSVIAAGVLLAAAAKSAQLPFSTWLFAAMAGPTPVSALLHSATLVAAGTYVLIRLGPDLVAVTWFAPITGAIGLATAIGGGVVALVQTDAKRVLAASTSAQYGLMFVAVAAGSTAAAAAHLVAHAAFKSLLFLGAGTAIHAAGSGWLGGMRLGRRLPAAAGLSALGGLALMGLPPLGAAWTKEHIVSAAAESALPLGAGVVAASLLTALYAARYQLLAYGSDSAATTGRHRPPRAELMWSAALALVTVALSLVWLPGAAGWVEQLSTGTIVESQASEFAISLAVLVAGVWIAWQLRQRLLTLGLPERVRIVAADWLGLPAAIDAAVVRPVDLLSSSLARLDDRVIDAGIRAVAWIGTRVANLVSRFGELTFDGVVRGVASMTLKSAGAARTTDELAVDGVVEAGARGVGFAGETSRRLQTGQSHHYYLAIAVGFTVMLIVLLWSP